MELNYHSTSTPLKVYKTTKYWLHTDKGILLDTLMGNASFIFGYDNETIISSMRSTQDKVAFLNWKSTETCEDNDLLIDKLVDITGYSSIAWAVSGSDGVEAAIRINDLYWQQTDNTKKKVISFTPGYHGATYLARVLRGQHKSDMSIVLEAPRWYHVNDREEHENKVLSKLEETLKTNNDVGAVIFESMPWISGIKPWSSSWWTTIRSICTQYNVNLILDDCLGCCGKLGPYLSQDRYDIKADLVVLGKALTGGYSPLSGVCVNEKISNNVREVYDYGHTWQPNMAGVGAALGVLSVFDEKRIYQIEARLKNLGDKLISMNLGFDCTVNGLIFNLRLTNPVQSDMLIKHGLSGSLDETANKKAVDIYAPAIADDEYFIELEKRLISCLTDNATVVK